MNVTGRKAPAKPKKREKKKPKPIARKAPVKSKAQPIARTKSMSKRKQDKTKAIDKAIRVSKENAGWVCQVTGQQFYKGDPELVGAHILEGRWNNSRPRWNPADWRYICPMKAILHADFDTHKTPEARAKWIREKADALRKMGALSERPYFYCRRAAILEMYACRIEWICDMTKPEEARP